MKNKTHLVILAGLLSYSMTSHGAVIAWGAATNTTTPGDVSTNGTLIQANAEGATATVNTVTFAASNSLGSINVGQLNGGSTGDASFDTLLNELSFGGGTSTTIDLGSFTSGNVYEVQIFYIDQRTTNSFNDRVMTYGSSTGGGTVDLEADPNNAPSSPFGQYAIGTFTADGTDPDLSLATNGFGNAHISAWQVRDITPIPEPASTALLAFASTAMLLRRRK